MTGNDNFISDEDLLNQARQEQEAEGETNLDGSFTPDDKTETSEPTGQAAEGKEATGKAEQEESEQEHEQAKKPEGEADASTEQKPEEVNDGKKDGDYRAALRHSRRAESRAKQAAQEAMEEAKRLKEEIEALKSKVPDELREDMSEDEIEQVSKDFPLIGKMAKRIQELEASQTKPAAAKQADESGFNPPTFEPDIQEAIDEVPELLAWQMNPDQAAFQRAVALDTELQQKPEWAGKPLAERFAHVAKQVKGELSKPTTPQRRDPAKVIEEAETETPTRVSQMSGGAASNGIEPDYNGMSNEQILADLERRFG